MSSLQKWKKKKKISISSILLYTVYNLSDRLLQKVLLNCRNFWHVWKEAKTRHHWGSVKGWTKTWWDVSEVSVSFVTPQRDDITSVLAPTKWSRQKKPDLSSVLQIYCVLERIPASFGWRWGTSRTSRQFTSGPTRYTTSIKIPLLGTFC